MSMRFPFFTTLEAFSVPWLILIQTTPFDYDNLYIYIHQIQKCTKTIEYRRKLGEALIDKVVHRWSLSFQKRWRGLVRSHCCCAEFSPTFPRYIILESACGETKDGSKVLALAHFQKLYMSRVHIILTAQLASAVAHSSTCLCRSPQEHLRLIRIQTQLS